MTDLNTEPDVHDMVRELTAPYGHREPYAVLIRKVRYGRHWAFRAPALAHQLMTTALEGYDPTSCIDALDTLMFIDDEAGEWIDRLGGVIPADPIDPETLQASPADGTVKRLLRLHGLHPSTADCGKLTHRQEKPDPEDTEVVVEARKRAYWCCERGWLEHAVRRWWRQARITVGWDEVPYKPWNTCPVCGVKGGLRVKLEIQSAFCVDCRSDWDSSQIGLLADHIRAENLEEGVVAHESQDGAPEGNEVCA